MKLNIPPIKDIDTALYIYYSYVELQNQQILELFGNKSKATVNKLKQAVKEEMRERGVKSLSLYGVNTKIAFDVWGLDVEDLEQRRNKLMQLNLKDK